MPAKRACPTVGCPELTAGGRCASCRAQADRARGSSTERGYARNPEHRAFRAAVLARHPVCAICREAPSVIADHWPKSRRELAAAGLDVNDPAAGRGLCRPCDGRQTAERQPGGWAAR